MKHYFNKLHWKSISVNDLFIMKHWRVEVSSLTGVITLWSLSKTHLSKLSTGATQEDPSLYNWKIVDGT